MIQVQPDTIFCKFGRLLNLNSKKHYIADIKKSEILSIHYFINCPTKKNLVLTLFCSQSSSTKSPLKKVIYYKPGSHFSMLVKAKCFFF